MSRTIHSSTPPRNTHPLIHSTTHPLIYPTTKHALIYPTTQSQRLFETHWCETHWCETHWCNLGGSVPNAALLVAIQFESNCIATRHKLYRVTCIHLNSFIYTSLIHLHVTHSSKRDSNCIEPHSFINSSPPSQQSVATWAAACQKPP